MLVDRGFDNVQLRASCGFVLFLELVDGSGDQSAARNEHSYPLTGEPAGAGLARRRDERRNDLAAADERRIAAIRSGLRLGQRAARENEEQSGKTDEVA